jgi:membrane-associated protease RseP (regulator of RpoE activity)
MIEMILRLVLSISLIWFILFFLILLHEYGHVAACNALKIQPERVVVGWPVIFRHRTGGLAYFGAS